MVRPSRFLALAGVVAALWPAAGRVVGADLGTLEAELRALRQQNDALRAQVDRQQRQLDDLARRYAEAPPSPAPVAPPVPVVAAAPATSAPIRTEEAPKAAAQRLGKVHLSGAAAVAFFAGQRRGTFPNEVLRLDEAKLFLEGPLGGNVYFFTEVDVFARDSNSANLRAGEIYVDFEGVSRAWGREGQMSLRVGRIDIPFGEEYAQRDAADNPLIAHSAADFWGVDEGIEAYGSVGGLQYVFAVQNGSNQAADDFTPGKGVTLRLGFDPAPGWHAALSGTRTGRIAQSGDVRGELWFGNDWIRRRAGSTAGEFWVQAFQADLRRTWKQGHLAAAVGRLRYDDNAPLPVRRSSAARFASLEGVRRLSAQWHVGARVSFIDAPAGFNLVGDGRDPSPSLTEFLSRVSVGAGYRLSPQLLLKADYSFNRGRWLGGAVRNGENQLAAEAAYTF